VTPERARALCAKVAAARARHGRSFVRLSALLREHAPALRAMELDLKALRFAADAAAGAAGRTLRGRYRRRRMGYLLVRAELDRVRVALIETRYRQVVGPWLRRRAARVLRREDAAKVNAPFVKAGGSPPFHEDAPIRRVKLLRPVELAQGQSVERMSKGWFGAWFLPCATAVYYSERELRDLAALPDSNGVELIGRFRLKPGTEFIVGGAGPIRARDARRVARFYTAPDGTAVGGGGHGGVLQFFIAPDWLGKRYPADVAALVRTAPVPRSHDVALLSLSRRWRQAYGDQDAGRRLWEEFLLYKNGARKTDPDLRRDLRVFEGFFKDSFRRQYPRAKGF
jgi:hypothetical protein